MAEDDATPTDAEDGDSMADSATLSRLRRIDAALTTLCDQCAAQDQRLQKIEDAVGRLKKIEGVVEQLRIVAERRDRHLVEWLDPAIDVTGTMAQIREIGSIMIQVAEGMEAMLKRELVATRSAIDLAIGAASVGDLEELEREIA